jgi:hypothetical protein
MRGEPSRPHQLLKAPPLDTTPMRSKWRRLIETIALSELGLVISNMGLQ